MEEVIISSEEDDFEEKVQYGQGAENFQKTELQEINRELAQVSRRSCEFRGSRLHLSSLCML